MPDDSAQQSPGFFDPDGIKVDPKDWADLKLSADAGRNYYVGGPFVGSYGLPAKEIGRLVFRKRGSPSTGDNSEPK